LLKFVDDHGAMEVATAASISNEGHMLVKVLADCPAVRILQLVSESLDLRLGFFRLVELSFITGFRLPIGLEAAALSEVDESARELVLFQSLVEATRTTFPWVESINEVDGLRLGWKESYLAQNIREAPTPTRPTVMLTAHSTSSTPVGSFRFFRVFLRGSSSRENANTPNDVLPIATWNLAYQHPADGITPYVKAKCIA
jgi:hypothetical protein